MKASGLETGLVLCKRNVFFSGWKYVHHLNNDKICQTFMFLPQSTVRSRSNQKSIVSLRVRLFTFFFQVNPTGYFLVLHQPQHQFGPKSYKKV